jgi:hypothetical protein
MPSIHVEANGHIGLGPAFLYPVSSDSLPQLDQKGMIGAGHAPMIRVLFVRRVWYARHYKLAPDRIEEGSAALFVVALDFLAGQAAKLMSQTGTGMVCGLLRVTHYLMAPAT